MRKRNLHLVYSSTPSEAAKTQREIWGLENARQLKLFDDCEKIRLILVPISDTSAHSFRRAIQEKRPALIIDTRTFPEFFSVYQSIDEAISDFQSKGIEYNRIPLGPEDPSGERWSNLELLKHVLGLYLERRAGAPVLLLTSTWKKSAQLASKVPGYLSQEVAETFLEEFSR